MTGCIAEHGAGADRGTHCPPRPLGGGIGSTADLFTIHNSLFLNGEML
jgi:hypothetical protein